MFNIPRFKIYGKEDKEIQENLQPTLDLRCWNKLENDEKEIIYQKLRSYTWFNNDYARYDVIKKLNHSLLRKVPGKRLHSIGEYSNSYSFQAAEQDFYDIFLNESKDVVFFMLTLFLNFYINEELYKKAEAENDDVTRKSLVNQAFEGFDEIAKYFNYIFEQFAINHVFTRNGLVTKQDKKITNDIYLPTLKILSDPKWKSVNKIIEKMFAEFNNGNMSRVPSEAYNVVYQFLKIINGSTESNGKGEFGVLFNNALTQNLIPNTVLTKSILNSFKSFISSERSNSSDAKPNTIPPTNSDALLMMNVVIILLQHWLTQYTSNK